MKDYSELAQTLELQSGQQALVPSIAMLKASAAILDLQSKLTVAVEALKAAKEYMDFRSSPFNEPYPLARVTRALSQIEGDGK